MKATEKSGISVVNATNTMTNLGEKSGGKSNSTSSRKKKGKVNRGPVTPKLPTFDNHEEEADYMMNIFKVKLCTRRRRHTWSGCPCAHHGETARRRDPTVHSAVPCPEMKQGEKCPRGDNCPYSHHDFEYWLHPARYRTVMCNKGTNCNRSLCFFAHTIEQLRVSSEELLDPIDGTPARDVSPFGTFMDNPALSLSAAANDIAATTATANTSSPEKDNFIHFASRNFQSPTIQENELKQSTSAQLSSSLTASSEICNILVSSSSSSMSNKMQTMTANSSYLSPSAESAFSSPMFSRHQSIPINKNNHATTMTTTTANLKQEDLSPYPSSLGVNVMSNNNNNFWSSSLNNSGLEGYGSLDRLSPDNLLFSCSPSNNSNNISHNTMNMTLNGVNSGSFTESLLSAQMAAAAASNFISEPVSSTSPQPQYSPLTGSPDANCYINRVLSGATNNTNTTNVSGVESMSPMQSLNNLIPNHHHQSNLTTVAANEAMNLIQNLLLRQKLQQQQQNGNEQQVKLNLTQSLQGMDYNQQQEYLKTAAGIYGSGIGGGMNMYDGTNICCQNQHATTILNGMNNQNGLMNGHSSHNQQQFNYTGTGSNNLPTNINNFLNTQYNV